MTTSQDDQQKPKEKRNQGESSPKAPLTKSNREQIRQILLEFGLDPNDYIFNKSEPSSPDLHSKLTIDTSSNRLLTFASEDTSAAKPQPPPRPVINRKTVPPLPPREVMSERRTSSPPPLDLRSLDRLEPHETHRSAEDYVRQVTTAENPPVRVVKQSDQNLVYKKEIRIRYLQPPTPPPPAPIIIRERHIPPAPPQSPLLIRERKPEPRTPPPLTIRERPPTPPPLLEPYVVEKTIPPPPPPPRQIVVERLPTPPPKPRTVIFEKWLPYKKVKRPVLLQKAPPAPPPPVTRNVIVEYEPLKAYTVRRVIEEGVFRVDPEQYVSYRNPSEGDVRMVDRIDDLPPPSDELLRVINDYKTTAAAETYRSAHYSRSPSNIDQLINVSRLAQTPIQRPSHVNTPQRSSSKSSSHPLSTHSPAQFSARHDDY